MDLDAVKIAFIQESRELLEEMEKALLSMERDGASEESINAVFRAAHTIKGSAGLFGMDPIVYFTHNMESVLDQIRSGSLTMDDNKIALFLACADHIKQLVNAIECQENLEEQDTGNRLQLLEKLRKYLAHPAPEKAVSLNPGTEAHAEILDADHVASESWHISLRLASDLLRSGMDPLSFIRYLQQLGTITHVEVVSDSSVSVVDMDPESLYLGFEIQLTSNVDKQTIANVFEFIAEGSSIHILPPRSKIQEYLELLDFHSLPEDRLGEILIACKALTQDELNRAIRLQNEAQSPTKPLLGQILVDQAASPSVVVAAALNKQQQSREKHIQETRLLKVDVCKLDALINLVGELVIATATARISLRREEAHESEEILNQMSGLVESIRDASLGLRMVPVGDVFQRFPRVVRDVSKELDKKIELVITGAETELDKTMIDKVIDPLTHIIRNAIDHGLESKEVRLAAGKPETGILSLHAYHNAGGIVIEVRDDGAGMNRAKIRQKALEKGLITAEQVLSDAEILDLIFEPGFSTADTVTNLSGRGVGMDVVRRGIELLRGKVDIESIEGKGSTIYIRLPLTLAIIDGFQIRVGNLSYVVPLDLVQECADLAAENVHRNIVRIGDEALPFLRLRTLFAIPGEAPPRESLLVVQYGEARVGLVVDSLVGELQAVIKPMGDLFANMKGIVGTTILGTGGVAMILDVPYLAQYSTSKAITQTSL